jgi:hypothetical protein
VDPIITIADLRNGALPNSDIDAMNTTYPEFIASVCDRVTRLIYARLRKRYKLPLVAPYPPDLIDAAIHLATWQVYVKRGVSDETSLLSDELKAERDAANTWLLEVANSETGLLELATLDSAANDGSVEKGGPFVYSEASPYDWTDRQSEAVRYG